MMPELADLMGSHVTVLNSTARDKYGKRTHEATGTVLKCRIQTSENLVKDAEGKEVVVVGKVYVLGEPDVYLGDKVILPDGSSPVIMKVETANDEFGRVNHTIIYLTNG